MTRPFASLGEIRRKSSELPSLGELSARYPSSQRTAAFSYFGNRAHACWFKPGGSCLSEVLGSRRAPRRFDEGAPGLRRRCAVREGSKALRPDLASDARRDPGDLAEQLTQVFRLDKLLRESTATVLEPAH